MGKGDKKTRRGKISMGSYGVLRPRKEATSAVTSEAGETKKAVAKKAAPKKVAAPKKAAAKKAE